MSKETEQAKQAALTTVVEAMFETAPRWYMLAMGAPTQWPSGTSTRSWFTVVERTTIKNNIRADVEKWDDASWRQVMGWTDADWEAYWKQTKQENQSLVLHAGDSTTTPAEAKQLEEMTVGKKNTGTGMGGGAYYDHAKGGTGYYQQGAGYVTATKATPTTFKFGGITVTAGPFRDIKYLGAYDVLIDLTNGAKPASPLKIIGELSTILTVPEPRNFISVDWPDMGVLPLPAQFYSDLYEYLRKCKGHLGVGCMAGQGRTGTVLTALYMIAMNKDVDAALAHIRKVYCPHAVETEAQKAYLRTL